MPQINPIGAATSLATVGSAPSQELGEQEFLNLLMTQLGNQDPLNPMESADFAAQVASMNQVKQLMGANERLDQLMLGMTSMNNQSAVQLVGKEVIARGDTFTHAEGQAHELQVELPKEADTVTITVRNAEGHVVRIFDKTDLAAGMQTIAWSGIGDGNSDVPPGELTFDVQAKDADGEPMEITTYVRGRVDELSFEQGYPMLVIGGIEVGMDQILKVLDATDRFPPAPTEEAADDVAADAVVDDAVVDASAPVATTSASSFSPYPIPSRF